MNPCRLRFDEFEFDLERDELFRGTWPLDLRVQPARLLGLLIRSAGKLVTRDEIQQALWDSATHVDFDQGINQCVRQVRAALDDTADTPRFIETVPRRGYRFIGAIEPITRVGPGDDTSDGGDTPADDGPSESSDSWRGPMLALLVGGIALASVLTEELISQLAG